MLWHGKLGLIYVYLPPQFAILHCVFIQQIEIGGEFVVVLPGCLFRITPNRVFIAVPLLMRSGHFTSRDRSKN